ncbi:uncharacterized protein RJT20DRAFT_56763 [Scheffersomyces xylosifermentans]|uniref:uncharacterized protein n=1 Tax=Scheffersomyces xylosifermentans TaxID=1304137 RepID=UPI00315D5551
MDFEALEDADGVRLSWSNLPKSRLQHTRNIIPLGAMYTPLNNKSTVTVLPKEELVSCRQCRSFANPFSPYDKETWMCRFCSFINRISMNHVDAEGNPALPPCLAPQNTTVEYQTGRVSTLPPIFFYVVDTCFESEDVADAFQSLKESLIVSLSLLPENALVGLVTFGKHVQIHDLLSNDNRAYTFNGTKEYTVDQLSKSLGLLALGLSGNYQAQNNGTSIDGVLGVIGRKFLQPVSIVEYQLTNIIENLATNTFPHSKFKERPARATGSALSITSLLLNALLGDHIKTTGGHLLCFIGGACTVGPGKIVDNLLKEPLRSHHDIERAQQATLPQGPNTSSKTKVDTSLFKQAKTYYHKVTQSLVSMGLSCNFFIGSYDQIGLFEMDEICYKTGGVVVMSDSFSTAIFKQSFVKFFRKQDEDNSEYLDMGFNATLEVRTTPDLKIDGLIGNATALPVRKDNPTAAKSVSMNSIGEGSTNSWKLCNVNPQSTYALYFDKLDSGNSDIASIQFLFHYQHPSGEMRLRVTTVPLYIKPDADMISLEQGFDQEAAVVLLARDAINKLQPDNSNAKSKPVLTQVAVVKNLDKILIDFCTRVSVYTAGVMDSFRLSSTYALLPQFLFHLRRSPFINVFNNSPDETSFVRHVFMHEDVNNSLIMIQPTLLSYDVDTFGAVDETTGEPNIEPEPVLLDSLSLGHSKILLLDTFFHILIHHGSKVAEWRKAGYHEQPEYAHFKEFLEAPKREAMEILMDRFPLPRFIDCDEGGSQARFLMAKLNPSTSYATNPNHLYGFGDRFDVFTDDTSLQSFMDHVQKVVTAQK